MRVETCFLHIEFLYLLNMRIKNFTTAACRVVKAHSNLFLQSGIIICDSASTFS